LTTSIASDARFDRRRLDVPTTRTGPLVVNPIEYGG
jgi:hypothetical protein